MKSLYLLDGHAIVYKYYFAYKDDPLKTSTGIPTSSAYGMSNILATLLKNYFITHIGVIFDPPYKTWRKEFYPQYKAHREKPDDITHHLEMTYALIKQWGIYTAAFRPLEADDAIGILAKKAIRDGFDDVVIVTKDKDMAQLVGDKIRLLDLGKRVGRDQATYIDRDAVFAKYNVYPEHIADYLALCGDKVDNVPGVGGIGPKTAAELLIKYGNIDEIYKNLDSLTKSKKSKFDDASETIKRDRILTSLKLDCELPVTWDELVAPPTTYSEDLLRVFEELEFHSVLKTIAS